MDEEDLRQQAIEGFENRRHYQPFWVDHELLERSGILDRVTELLTTSGWPGLLELFSDADIEDTSEFMATLNYLGSQDHQGISYRHRGEPRTCNMVQLRAVFEWPAEGIIYQPFQSSWHATWNLLAPTRYNGGNSSPRDFPDAALFYLHQIMSKTLFARKNSDKVGQLEMSVLAMLVRGDVIHWGHYFCKHLMNLRTNSPIACGGMVTYLLRQLHHAPEVENHRILYGARADELWFRQGRHIQVTPEGNYQWIYFRNEALRPPPPAHRPVGRPPGQGRGRHARGQARAIYDPEQEQEEEDQSTMRRERRRSHQAGPSQQAAPVQDQLARQFLDTVFNSTRASILAGQEFDLAPAPPGWNMGDPIPPEYLQPRRPPRRR